LKSVHTVTAGKSSRRPGVESVFGTKDQAINYAQNRASLSLNRALDFWIQAAMSNKQFRSTKRIEGCDVPCGEARAVAFACGTIATHSRVIFTEGADQATKRLL
jgi:hypothetical protein